MEFGQDSEEPRCPLWSHASRVPIFTEVEQTPQQIIKCLIDELMENLALNEEELPPRSESRGENLAIYRKILQARRRRLLKQLTIIKCLLRYTNRSEFHVLIRLYKLSLDLTDFSLHFGTINP